MAKKKVVIDASMEKSIVNIDELPFESTPQSSSPKKKNKRAEVVIFKGKVVKGGSTVPNPNLVLFPPNVSALKDLSGFIKKADNLLFLANEEHLKEMRAKEVIDTGVLASFQALQMQLQVKTRLMASRERCVKLQMANESLKKKLDKVDKAKK
ncbi:hypothetical protein Q3G72_014420 [Acer saccharum]|nr:hypothetical protein Q3G72_014420 [Acer saccharum]